MRLLLKRSSVELTALLAELQLLMADQNLGANGVSHLRLRDRGHRAASSVFNSLAHSGVAAASLNFRATRPRRPAGAEARVGVGDWSFQRVDLLAKLAGIGVVALRDRRHRSHPDLRGCHPPVHLQIDRKPYRTSVGTLTSGLVSRGANSGMLGPIKVGRGFRFTFLSGLGLGAHVANLTAQNVA
jgi:hypothetical protein